MPAFGSPAIAASASSFSRSSTSASSAGSATSAKRGACRVGRREARVAAAAVAAAGEDDASARTGEVGDQLALDAERLRPDRDVDLDRLAVGAVLSSPRARPAAAGLELRLRPERRQVAEILVRDEHDVAAAAAVAAVGPALRHVLLAPEAQASVAAAARQHLDAGAIVEQGS